MVLRLGRGSLFATGTVCVLLVGVACSSNGLGSRRDAAASGSGGTTSTSAPVEAGGQPSSATGGIPGSGGATATAGNPGTGGATATGGNSTATSAPGTGGAPVDAAPTDAPRLGDASHPLVDGPNGLAVIDPDYTWRHFEELVRGTWLIGWYGGQDHFSWLRITPSSGGSFGGELAVLAEPSIPAGVPYWTCNGSAFWQVTARPMTLDLRLEPAGCASEILIFEWFRPTSSRGAFLEARISGIWVRDGGYGSTEELTGMKYPDDVCNADFTACKASP